MKADKEYLARHVRHARICEIVAPSAIAVGAGASAAGAPASVYLPSLSFWKASLLVFVYQLSEDGPSNESAGGDGESAAAAGSGALGPPPLRHPGDGRRAFRALSPPTPRSPIPFSRRDRRRRRRR
jgi:hypothetical protein